jgi:hypothetical protein
LLANARATALTRGANDGSPLDHGLVRRAPSHAHCPFLPLKSVDDGARLLARLAARLPQKYGRRWSADNVGSFRHFNLL